MILVEIVGWIGMILVFTAYMLITMNKVDRSSLRYHGINLIGASCICINALVNTAYPSATLNILWAIIAVLGLLKKI
jgi:hypothetical protein